MPVDWWQRWGLELNNPISCCSFNQMTRNHSLTFKLTNLMTRTDSRRLETRPSPWKVGSSSWSVVLSVMILNEVMCVELTTSKNSRGVIGPDLIMITH